LALALALVLVLVLAQALTALALAGWGVPLVSAVWWGLSRSSTAAEPGLDFELRSSLQSPDSRLLRLRRCGKSSDEGDDVEDKPLEFA
jgi:hypothetical protein